MEKKEEERIRILIPKENDGICFGLGLNENMMKLSTS